LADGGGDSHRMIPFEVGGERSDSEVAREHRVSWPTSPSLPSMPGGEVV
jgi:hypothetical protein